MRIKIVNALKQLTAILPIVGFVFWVAIVQMVKNDRHIKSGEKEKIWDEMIK